MTPGALVRQDPPNDGTLVGVGELGIVGAEMATLDILSDGQGGNEGWLLTGATLYSVDLDTGAATEVGTIEGIEGDPRDMAIIPSK